MTYKTKLSASLSTLALLAVSACGSATSDAPETTAEASTPVVTTASAATPPNFIFMIGDDMGQETLSCYNVADVAAHTPNLDKLCAEGMRFDNFWSQPVCSPTRATLLTGQYGFENGIGAPLGPTPGIEWNIPGGDVDDDPSQRAAREGNVQRGGRAGGGGAGGRAGGGGNNQAGPGIAASYTLTDGAPAPATPESNSTAGLDAAAYTFLQALKSDPSKDYQTAAVGKWHLAGSGNAGLAHPNAVGFDHYTGPMRGGGVATYTGWSKSTNGDDPFGINGYVTTDTVNDGIAWIDTVEGQKPFFLWVAFNAPHTPFHMPPAELLSSDLKDLSLEDSTPLQQYNAMLEAMDTEIGRLLESLDPETRANTYIAFMGDNGTPAQSGQAVPYGRQKSKGSLYQGGINVPFMVDGPGIDASVSPALANSVDIFNTVLDISGITAPDEANPMHSVSLKPVLEDPDAQVRDYVFADIYGLSGPTQKNQRTVSNGRYKYIENVLENTVELYDLESDPFESENLLSGDLSEEVQANLDSLRADIVAITNGQ